MPDTAEHWTGIYERRSYTDVSWYQAEPTRSLDLLAAAEVRADDPILDVGAGASVLVDRLIQRGFRHVSVLDISPTALNAAKQRLGPRASEVHWITADLLRWKPDRRYRVWHDRAVFHFLTEPSDRAHYLDVLRAALQPGGSVIIATFAADGPESCSGLPVARYAPGQLADEFSDWRVVEDQREEHLTPGGVVQAFTWLHLTTK